MDHVPIAHAAINSGILTHRGYDDAVDELELANSQRTEQSTHIITYQKPDNCNGSVTRKARLRVFSCIYPDRLIQ
jgi:hypothetical protein